MWFWLRRLVRKNTRPIPMSTAEKWNFRLSLLYGFFAWNAGGFAIYMIFTGRNDWPSYYGLKSGEEEKVLRSPSENFANVLGIKKAHVVHLSGFQKVNEYDIDATSQEENTSENNVETKT